jgi:cell division protein FtsB
MSSTVPSPTVTSRAAATRAARTATVRRRVRVTARASVLAIVVVTLLTIAIAPVRTLLEQRGELDDLQRQAAQLQVRNTQLEARIAELDDPDYIEQLARECLGMVEPGETAFVVIPRRGAPPTTQC